MKICKFDSYSYITELQCKYQRHVMYAMYSATHSICSGWQALGQWRVNWKREISEGVSESATKGTDRAEVTEKSF